MNYLEAIDYLLNLPDMERARSGPQARVMPLETMKDLLARLAYPEQGRKTIHVTGSKGKGSTSLYMAALLTGSGAGNSLYTSPHLHSYTERLLHNLQPILEEDLGQCITAVMPVVEAINALPNGNPVSTFGAITAAFFEFARRNGADWQVVEVGLGGGQDATNVFEHKELAVITPVSLEHTAILGFTCAEIMKMKAQIITPGSVAVISVQQDPEALQVVTEHCAAVNARLLYVPELYDLEIIDSNAHGQQLKISRISGGSSCRNSSYNSSYDYIDTVFLRARGAHQARNFVTALAAFDNLLERKLVAGDRKPAIKFAAQAALPGRCESVSFADRQFILDGAHNGESAAVLCQTLGQQLKLPLLGFIVGCNNDKNIEGIVRELLPVCEWVIATRSSHAKSMEPEVIAAACAKVGLTCLVSNDWQEAIDLAVEKTNRQQSICVAGSLYLIADVRRRLLLESGCSSGNHDPLPWSVLPDGSFVI